MGRQVAVKDNKNFSDMLDFVKSNALSLTHCITDRELGLIRFCFAEDIDASIFVLRWDCVSVDKDYTHGYNVQ